MEEERSDTECEGSRLTRGDQRVLESVVSQQKGNYVHRLCKAESKDDVGICGCVSELLPAPG